MFAVQHRYSTGVPLSGLIASVFKKDGRQWLDRLGLWQIKSIFCWVVLYLLNSYVIKSDTVTAFTVQCMDYRIFVGLAFQKLPFLQPSALISKQNQQSPCGYYVNTEKVVQSAIWVYTKFQTKNTYLCNTFL